MKTFATLALIGTASAFTYQSQTWLSDATCTGAASTASPTAVITSGAASCGATTGGSMRVTGTCGAAVVATWIGSATCAGNPSLTAPAVNLGQMKPNTCIGAGGGSTKYTTDCSAGSMLNPGAWSMVLAAATMVVSMKN